MKKEKRSKRKIIIIILLCIVFLMIAALWGLSVYVYNENFGTRFETAGYLMLYTDDFDGLTRTQYRFPSDRGQMLTGYMYSSGEEQRGIIILAHGFGGGGHNSYMNIIDYFAEHGYYVFAYDATGNDESEGNKVGGLPQGTIDLEHAISFVEENEAFPDLPIGLFGHSWGGYSVCTALVHHPEVKAVIECAGFVRSSDMIEAEGKRQAGNFIYAMLPFVRLHEFINYGSYSQNSGLDGLAATDAAVMIVHSSDDTTVPTEYGYDVYYGKYRDDPRFVFILRGDKGHNVFEDNTYRRELNEKIREWSASLGYDTAAPENAERFIREKSEYITSILDRRRYCDMLDKELAGQFTEFYDEHL